MLANNKTLFYKVAAIFFLIVVNVINIGNPILEQHSFRQTQTAISIFYLIQDGFTLNYITPVLGKSYIIPFEFPIFHFIVGFIAKYFNLPLDIIGRLISLAFSIGVLLFNDLLLKEIQIDKRARLFAFLLIVCSPIFLFWSGTFMIESTALFFTVASLLSAAKYFKGQSFIYLMAWLCLASMGLLEKGTTTLVPYLLGCIAILCITLQKGNKNDGGIFEAGKLIKAAVLLSILAVPIALGYGWVIYTDILKSSNPIAVTKITSTALGSWNYGTLAQRFSSSFWVSDIYLRALGPSAFFGFGLAVAIYCLIGSAINKYKKWVIVGFAILYIVPQMVFTNLFIVHNYYHYAVIIYLCNLVAISYDAVGWRYKKIPVYLLIATCICSLVFFMNEYRHAKFRHIEQSHVTLSVAHQIQQEIDQEDVFVLFGYDWSSEVAYYAQRKSLTVPEWYLDKFQMEKLDTYLDKLPKLIVICNNAEHRYDRFIPTASDYALIKELQGCSFFKQRAQ